MVDHRRIDSVLLALEERQLFHIARRIDASELGGAAAIEGEAVVEGREVTIRLVLDRFFPLTLPRFFLRPWDALGFIPHVTQSGFICYNDPEGIVLDRHRPAELVEEAFRKATSVLADGVTRRNRADFVDEFEWHWNNLPGHLNAISVLDPLHKAGRVTIAVDREKRLWVAGNEGDVTAFLNVASIGTSFTLHEGIYLPLEADTIIVPPRPDRPFWTSREARRALLSGLSKSTWARLRRLPKKCQEGKAYVIVKLPRPSGGATIIGILYEGVDGQHPLLGSGKANHLTPLCLSRFDRSYLIERGGGSTGLVGKRVLLIGCGAVGGHIAFELARAGVLDLSLVDPDVLKPDNSFRHALGRRYWGRNKAKALKEEIEAQLPYARITAIDMSIELAISTSMVDLGAYDLVVLALGNPTVELYVNERLHQIEHGPAAVFTWLEPLGIGGHALLTGVAVDGGCFECLYTPRDSGDENLENRAAFARHGQSFGKALSGCGSLHTPYGSVDAVRTAALATRLAIDALTGKEKGNALLSWKGDATAFEQAGFSVSDRYAATESELLQHRYAYRNPRCRACGTSSRGGQ